MALFIYKRNELKTNIVLDKLCIPLHVDDN